MQLASFHPNVIGFLGANITAGLIVMELASFSVHDILYRSSRQQLWDSLTTGQDLQSIGWKVAVMQDIASALAFIHFHGVLHRDIKSPNVMLVVDQNRRHSHGIPLIAKVSDFGLALAVSTSSSGRSVGSSVSKHAVGSIPYMAPELQDPSGGAPKYSPAADIYAFGILANELLLEQEPWAGELDVTIISQVVFGMKRPVRFVSAGEGVELLVLSMIGDHEVGCLHQNPLLRPTATELCSENRLFGVRVQSADKISILEKIELALVDAGRCEEDLSDALTAASSPFSPASVLSPITPSEQQNQFGE